MATKCQFPLFQPFLVLSNILYSKFDLRVRGLYGDDFYKIFSPIKDNLYASLFKIVASNIVRWL